MKATIELWSSRPELAAKEVAACLDAMGEQESLFYTVRVYELGARAHADIAARAPADRQSHSRAAASVDRLLARLDTRIARVAGTPPLVLASRMTLVAERTRLADVPDAGAWQEATTLWEAIGNRYLAAYARWRQAEALLTSNGDRRFVESLMRDAYGAAEELGARPLLGELEALARRSHIDLQRTAVAVDAPNAALEQFELTPREIEVLALLAHGLTNREIASRLFISNKTASVHVSHILSKLAVPNRAAAAATAQRLRVGQGN